MINQTVTLTVTLNVPSDFTGRIFLYLEKGQLKNNCILRDNEIVNTLTRFPELLIRAGTDTHHLTRE
ncbi:hypothetical protein VQZ80_000210 [Salmonella enterica]|nr:hypothetical protein [Salmonella enterica]EEI9213426.1 hypothetical protein [Salmonella enterica subsp. enterica serovar Carrau]EEJ7416932.1 hypothetical protein [Salmonella enterica subsp. enterica serovar Sandiego]EDI6980805.1 hypothetical protein [Salmonella enterica]EEK8144557.1 hypothetical protein [Salmonella enterica]